MANKQTQKDQPEVTQITIDEVIAEAEAKEASNQKYDVCADCPNHTCDWGVCWMSKN